MLLMLLASILLCAFHKCWTLKIAVLCFLKEAKKSISTDYSHYIMFDNFLERSFPVVALNRFISSGRLILLLKKASES